MFCCIRHLASNSINSQMAKVLRLSTNLQKQHNFHLKIFNGLLMYMYLAQLINILTNFIMYYIACIAVHAPYETCTKAGTELL